MRLLVVEDDVSIAQSIKDGLELESYAVDVEHDGESGFYAASSEEYDLLILDWMLPGMDGLEIVKKLRQEKFSTPILMLTAKNDVADKVSGLNKGADDYLSKPFAFEELVARVNALLRRPVKSDGNILTAQDLTLNTVSKDVHRGGKKINLSTKEYALVEYLLRNKGVVLSKNNIINHVWDFDADVLPNTVEVYVTYLRNKIDKPFKARPIIETVRGFGYKIAN